MEAAQRDAEGRAADAAAEAAAAADGAARLQEDLAVLRRERAQLRQVPGRLPHGCILVPAVQCPLLLLDTMRLGRQR